MAGPTPLRDQLYQRIEQCRANVAKATQDYSQGRGTVEAVNKADRKLIDAHAALETQYSGRVPD